MLTRRLLLGGSAMLGAAALLHSRRAAAADAVVVGVSGPLTGPNAQYGAQWKASFDLAIEQIKAAGGPAIEYVFEDSQSDPRQSVAIAQKFVNDDRIVMEIGDFSSTASMAASPIYQRAKLVQFGMTVRKAIPAGVGMHLGWIVIDINAGGRGQIQSHLKNFHLHAVSLGKKHILIHCA